MNEPTTLPVVQRLGGDDLGQPVTLDDDGNHAGPASARAPAAVRACAFRGRPFPGGKDGCRGTVSLGPRAPACPGGVVAARASSPLVPYCAATCGTGWQPRGSGCATRLRRPVGCAAPWAVPPRCECATGCWRVTAPRPPLRSIRVAKRRMAVPSGKPALCSSFPSGLLRL